MSILSKIRSWFWRGSLSTTSISEVSHQNIKEEINEQDSKAEKLIEAIEVAHEEQPQNVPINSLGIQSENTSDIPKNEENVLSNIEPIESIQPIQFENVPVPVTPEAGENLPSQNIAIEPESEISQNITITPESVSFQNIPIQTESLPSNTQLESVPSNIQPGSTSFDIQPIQLEPKVKRSRKSKSRRSRSKKKLMESTNPET